MKLDFNFSMKCVEIRNINGPESNIGQIISFQILGLTHYIVIHYIAFRCPLDQEGILLNINLGDGAKQWQIGGSEKQQKQSLKGKFSHSCY